MLNIRLNIRTAFFISQTEKQTFNVKLQLQPECFLYIWDGYPNIPYLMLIFTFCRELSNSHKTALVLNQHWNLISWKQIETHPHSTSESYIMLKWKIHVTIGDWKGNLVWEIFNHRIVKQNVIPCKIFRVMLTDL